MADITIPVDAELERARGVLTRDGRSRETAVRQAVVEAARRMERAAGRRREVLRMPIGTMDGVDLGAEISGER
ncbi:hypothetical protein OG474_14755 [Kribbella sp. NBC_01505]|uniref:hypothetical protein n=1 Tax=Kribbella sp. NBC_01505 TaxID=2903580 RepID=UPI0038705A83